MVVGGGAVGDKLAGGFEVDEGSLPKAPSGMTIIVKK